MTLSMKKLKQFNQEIRDFKKLTAELKEEKKDFEIEKAEYRNLLKAVKTLARGRYNVES